MSRIVNRPIVVTLQNEKPHTFIDRDESHTIAEVVDTWREAGDWMHNEPARTIYRVLTSDGIMLDIEEVGGLWYVYRIWD